VEILNNELKMVAWLASTALSPIVVIFLVLLRRAVISTQRLKELINFQEIPLIPFSWSISATFSSVKMIMKGISGSVFILLIILVIGFTCICIHKDTAEKMGIDNLKKIEHSKKIVKQKETKNRFVLYFSIIVGAVVVVFDGFAQYCL
jgi:hypothetical protein